MSLSIHLKKAEIERELQCNAIEKEKLLHKKRKLEEIDLPTPPADKKKKFNASQSDQLKLTSFFPSLQTATQSTPPVTPISSRIINISLKFTPTRQPTPPSHSPPMNKSNISPSCLTNTNNESSFFDKNEGLSSSTPTISDTPQGEEQEIIANKNDLNERKNTNENKNEVEESKTSSRTSMRKIIRVAWSKERKVEALKYLNSCSVLSVFHIYDRKIPIATLYTWKNSNTSERKTGSGRKVVSLELDEELFEWFLTVRSRGVKVSDALIQKKAFELRENYLMHSLLNSEESTHNKLLELAFSRGWLEKFKKRWRIVARGVTTTKIHPYSKLKKSAQAYFDDLDFNIVKHNISVFYNMDETAVFFDLEEKTTLEIVGRRCVPIQGHQDAKKRCTVILTVGSIGEKLQPMIILKANKPQGYQAGMRPDPEVYSISSSDLLESANRRGVIVLRSYTAWNSSYFMETYYAPFFHTHAQHSSRSLLIMDNFGGHFTEKVENKFAKFNVKTLSLAPNCTPILQPLDVSVNAPFKSYMRSLYQAWILRLVERQQSNPFLFVPSDEQIIRWVIDAWDSVKTETIIKSINLS
jgi:hypothetical protein